MRAEPPTHGEEQTEDLRIQEETEAQVVGAGQDRHPIAPTTYIWCTSRFPIFSFLLACWCSTD